MELGRRCELLPKPGANASGLRASIKRYGEIAYIGPVEGLPGGEWIGVQLDKPLGKNDGSHDGSRYFSCPPLHGVFVRSDRINTDGEFPVLLDHAESIVHAKEEHKRELDRRRQLAQEARATTGAGESTDALTQAFWLQLHEQESNIRKEVARLVEAKSNPVASTVPKPSDLEALITKVHEMQEQAASAAGLYLSAYDIRQTQRILSRLYELLETTRSTLAPRKKFTFKAKAKETHTTPSTRLPSPSFNALEQVDTLDELVFSDRKDEVIIVDATSFDSDDRRDLSFSRLRNCVIWVGVETSALRADALTNCTIYTGPVVGSVWLEECDRCDISTACRQLRVHKSSATTFHLRILSHPIIEDCDQLQFGRYRLEYDGLETQLTRCGMAKETGMWHQVNDFKWHKTQPSPHWKMVDPKVECKVVEGLEGRVSMH